MPIPDTKRRNNDKYNSTCDNIMVRPKKDVGADIRAAADAAEQSLQGYILQAVRDRMARDGFTPSASWPFQPTGGATK